MLPTLPILTFEIRYHLRRPTFWLITGLFFTIGLVDIVSKAEQGNAFFFVNSPSQIFQTTLWYSIFSILAASAFVAETFVRDNNCQIEALILATPIRKWDYLATRFAAAFGITLIAFSAYIPGMITGTLVPGLSAYALGPFRADGYLASYSLIALPNIFLVSALAFALAARTRSLAITFAGSIILVMLYLASLMMVGADKINYQQYPFWAMLDPFGFYAFESNTLNWTVFEHNTLMPSVGGLLIWNRLLWLTIGLLVWITSYRTYKMQAQSSAATTREKTVRRKRNLPEVDPLLGGVPARRGGSATSATQRRTTPSFLTQLLYRTTFELRTILQGKAFWLLTGFGLISLIMAAQGARSFNYSNPSTDILIHSATVYLDYILFAIIVVYAAELVWRDRTLR
ncbi:MAG: peptidase, partial [Cyanobacteria bacterium P01_D01_bin.36]